MFSVDIFLKTVGCEEGGGHLNCKCKCSKLYLLR